MRFSEHFNLNRTQHELDFLDIPLETDIRLFIDPYSLATSSTGWGIESHALAVDFFQRVLDRLRASDRSGAAQLLAPLREDNRTRLGYSRSDPKGTGLGDDLAGVFLRMLEASSAFPTGRIEDLEDAQLLVQGIGLDIVSDMLTSILRERLAIYTKSQCELLGVPAETSDTLRAWRAHDGWTEITVRLPTDGVRPILLVPRSILRKGAMLQPNAFLRHVYNHQSPHACTSLEAMLRAPLPRDPRGRLLRGECTKQLKETMPIKDVVSQLAADCPDEYSSYKNSVRSVSTALTPGEIELIHPEPNPVDIQAVMEANRSAAINGGSVLEASRAVTGMVLSAFHPMLQHPARASVNIAGCIATVISDSSRGGIVSRLRLAQAGPSPSVVLLTTSMQITPDALIRLDTQSVVRSCGASAVMVVAPSVDKGVLARRKDLVGEGVLVVTVDELAEIAASDAGPEASVASLQLAISG